MRQLSKHFQSFDSFVKVLYSLRNRIDQGYYRSFNKRIRIRLSKEVSNFYSNAIFKKQIKELIFLPNDFLKAIQDNEAKSLISEADLSMNHVFNLLGSGDVKVNPIDWHTDFKTNYRWAPGKFFKDYIQEGIDSNSDVKVPRELSRCHHFLKLGIAYQLTKDEKYFSRCIEQMDDWIEENPLMHSINWGCTMDVAIRAINWIWMLRLISDSPLLTEEFITRVKISLYEHGWFIYSNPEKSSYNNHNHYLTDLAGQIHLGLLFEQMPNSKKWIEEGIKELFREVRMQILPTGMSYERSTNYNRFVLELILITILLLKRNGYEIPSDIWYRLEKMLEFIMFTLKPDGNTPIVGDQDDARLLPFGCESNIDYRYLLSLGSILYKRTDFKIHGDGFNVYCGILGGFDAQKKYDQLQTPNCHLASMPFPDAGFYVMRNENNYLLFNASGKGLYPELASGTHTHSDLLSFELCINGKSFLVDPGSFVYTADATQRALFRSTSMHNTVTVDAESQNVIRKEVLWDFERNAVPEILNWESNELMDIVVAQHTGYLRLKEPVLHKRTILFDKQKTEWQITDELSGVGSHIFEFHFHFDIGIDFSISDSEINTLCNDGNNISLKFARNEVLSLRKEKTFVSKAYGIKEESLELVVTVNSVCPTTLITTISHSN